ncbi:MAG: DUF1232 domain-containing protein [Rhodobiaceae bacterium]|nr:DUF1232 domain-containing protein [Rhodobiaceae bacterium]MCC0016378.1 DUF1232 domain-containing protein [Rhodobiaceae bacterium]MCC0041312.1 DUF1232 domain-containing protein [Rhodobiaceae bacterium]MCC0052714.1 DUF1232 domain-containing protein [Rhodobiaceae bacterium]
MSGRLRSWAGRLRRDATALYLAARDPRTPRAARFIAIAVAIYALSPIDLIPDFIPVLGQLDDLLIVPLGIWLALKLIPDEVMDEHRRAAEEVVDAPGGIAATLTIVLLWLVGVILTGWIAIRLWRILARI